MLRLDPISIQFEPSDRGLASPPAPVLKCPLGPTAAPPSNLAHSTRCQWPALEESLSETHPYPMWANWLRDLAANGQPPFFHMALSGIQRKQPWVNQQFHRSCPGLGLEVQQLFHERMEAHLEACPNNTWGHSASLKQPLV